MKNILRFFFLTEFAITIFQVILLIIAITFDGNWALFIATFLLLSGMHIVKGYIEAMFITPKGNYLGNDYGANLSRAIWNYGLETTERWNYYYILVFLCYAALLFFTVGMMIAAVTHAKYGLWTTILYTALATVILTLFEQAGAYICPRSKKGFITIPWKYYENII